MGVVLLARDLRLDRLVAIKTLPQHLAEDANIRERFLREARTAAALAHPRIVPIHHADEIDGVVHFAMGYVDGGSVADLLREHGRLSAAKALPLLLDIAAALDYAHGRGVVHRDIKAENILIDAATGRAMVTDFGIARLAEAAPMTATGNILGTVHYMSPEQVSGERVDGRSDLYALGVLAFLLLSGRFPFEHEAASAVLVAHVTKDPPRLRSVVPDVPGLLADIVDRLLRKRPDERFASAGDLLHALQGAANVRSAALAPRPTNVPATGALPPAAQVPVAVLSSADANAVWERAAVLQQLTGQMQPPPLPVRPAPLAADAAKTEGFKLRDVLAAAQEAGIERRFVDRALAERLPVPAGQVVPDGIVREGPVMEAKPNMWVGSRTKLQYEAVIDGEVDPADYEVIIDEMRRAFDELGVVNVVGRTLTFTAMGSGASARSGRRLQVTIAARAGRTTIRAFEDFGQAAGGIIGGIVGGVGGGVGGATAGVIMSVTQNALVAFPAMFGVAALAFGVTRFGISRWSDRRARDLSAGVGRVAARVLELVHYDTVTHS